MCLFKYNKKLREENEFLHSSIKALHNEIEGLRKQVAELNTEISVKRNIIEHNEESMRKLHKQISVQQNIINKQNLKLNIQPRKKKSPFDQQPSTRAVKNERHEDHDPYIEE